MTTVNQAADFFIRQADNEAGDVMTHLKLQKLLYYAQGWHLALHGEPLFEARIEAWAHGPVCPDVWERFKHKGWEPITASDASSVDELDSNDRDFLNEVWEVYGQFSAKRLEEMTHDEAPYVEARGDLREYEKSSEEITREAMKAYFSGLRK
jgi:uncharacterized phage-associated protein